MYAATNANGINSGAHAYGGDNNLSISHLHNSYNYVDCPVHHRSYDAIYKSTTDYSIFSSHYSV